MDDAFYGKLVQYINFCAWDCSMYLTLRYFEADDDVSCIHVCAVVLLVLLSISRSRDESESNYDSVRG